MGCCSHRRSDLPASSLAPTDLQALHQPCASTAHSSSHLNALLSSPFPPPDKLPDSSSEQLQSAHFRQVLRPITRKEVLKEGIGLPKLTCFKCGGRAAGYCVQCRLRRYCRSCFGGDHQAHSKHVYLEYAVCKDTAGLLI